jgi:hypothetical protein
MEANSKGFEVELLADKELKKILPITGRLKRTTII